MSSSNITNSNRISPSVNQQVPEFVRIDHPTFVAFLATYYEWLESQGTNLYNPMDLKYVSDIDRTFDEFVTYFKKQYLLNFPETLAINQDTGTPVEPKTLLKNIKAFYQAKGTEKSFEFLFRILYDTGVEFYYPKVDILKASDGKWIQRKTVRLAGSTNGTRIFSTAGQRISQTSSSGTVIAAATVVDVTKYQLGSFNIYELNLSNINGTFVTSRPLNLTDGTVAFTEPPVYSVLGAITISAGGSKYRVGDPVVFTNAANDIGQGAKATVSQISSTGKILKIKIDDFGVNYRTAPTITVNSNTGTGFSGTVSVGAVCNFDGYYANNDGRLSMNKVIQDSHYYQNYSYVLKTEVVVNKYRDSLKKLIHPAGLGFFGQILIKRATKSDLHANSALFKYEVPLLGHYLPYTGKTFIDFSTWFTGSDGITFGYDPTINDPIISGAGGNPAPNLFTDGLDPLYETGFPRADPFWVTYVHPNQRIDKPVLARIEYDLHGIYGPESVGAGKDDFLAGTVTGTNSWSEWTMTGPGEREAWANGFTGGFKYAKLGYTGSTEFRKITFQSFFAMPLDDQFDSRADLGVLESNSSSPNF